MDFCPSEYAVAIETCEIPGLDPKIFTQIRLNKDSVVVSVCLRVCVCYIST